MTLLYVGVLFCIGQLLVADSIIVSWAANLNPQLQAFVRELTRWLEEHPEISVHATQNLLFYRFVTALLFPNLIAVALTIPHLITRDLSSNAIVIYASKAITRFDYLLGKAGIVLGMLTLTWLGPLLAAWVFGNLMAPNWNFFWHSRVALGHSIGFVATGMVFLAVLGLGVSALSSREKSTVGLYVVLWLVGNAFVPLGSISQPWLKQLSFQHDLRQCALAIFNPEADLESVQQNVPVFGAMLAEMRRANRSPWQEPDPRSPWPALGAFVLVSTAFVLRRTKPE
jgi:hypothetical protein